MKSTPGGTHHSFHCSELESLGSEKILNTGVFSMGRLEQLRIPRSREGGKHKGWGSAAALNNINRPRAHCERRKFTGRP